MHSLRLLLLTHAGLWKQGAAVVGHNLPFVGLTNLEAHWLIISMKEKPVPIHVFYDNSNAWGGAQAHRKANESEVPWVALRIHTTHMSRLIEQGRSAVTRVLAGSVPPSSEELWQWARKNKYQTDVLKKVESDDGFITEQGVDEILHLKIANVLIDYPKTDTLVMVTGDGNISEFGTGFISQIERALKLGWRIEVWSWSATLSRKYLALQKKWSQQLKLIPIDPFYESVTFVQPGHYHRIADGKREEFDLDGRAAAKLPALDTTSYFA
jgi:hypothetical protein